MKLLYLDCGMGAAGDMLGAALAELLPDDARDAFTSELNAAGIPGPSARVEDYSFSDAKKVLSVNLFGTFLMMHTVLPVMQAQKHGAILNFGSVSGVVGYPFESAYGASKAAIIHLTKNAASENGGNGGRINAISPGWVKTNMMATILDSYKNVGFDNADENVTLGPMGRPGTPEEIANVAAFLCSEEASYANGSNFLVDGGMTLYPGFQFGQG